MIENPLHSLCADRESVKCLSAGVRWRPPNRPFGVAKLQMTLDDGCFDARQSSWILLGAVSAASRVIVRITFHLV